MTAYLWSQLDAATQAQAMASAMAHPLMTVKVAARGVQLADSEAAKDRAAVWIHFGDGNWEARAAIWPRDLIAGLKVHDGSVVCSW